MPSNAILEQKKQIVADLTDKLNNAVAGVVVDYKGITVAEDTLLRKQMREANVDYFVVKNSMLSRAAENAGLDELKSVLEGTTAIALSNEDYIVAAKILNDFAEKKADCFEIKSGFMDSDVISVDKVKSIAKLPSREGLIAKMLGSLNAPICNLVYAIKAIQDKKAEEGEPA